MIGLDVCSSLYFILCLKAAYSRTRSICFMSTSISIVDDYILSAYPFHTLLLTILSLHITYQSLLYCDDAPDIRRVFLAFKKKEGYHKCPCSPLNYFIQETTQPEEDNPFHPLLPSKVT